MSDTWARWLAATASRTQAEQRQRSRVAREPQVIDFGSNDYLGLRDHQRLRNGPQLHFDASDAAAFGSGASPVIGGHSSELADLERALASLSGCDDALVFSSGFACNVGVLACLSDERCLVLSDRLNHASLIDGCRLGRGQRVVYPHLEYDWLEDYLRRNRHRFDRALIVTESVFSMDGDLADLTELTRMAEQFDCGCVVDEAHATGVYGARGGGLLEELGLSSRVLLKLGTLSKSLGGIGGFACGSSAIIDYLVDHCRSYLFSTAPPPINAHIARAAVELLPTMNLERERLRQNSRWFRSELSNRGWKVRTASGPDGFPNSSAAETNSTARTLASELECSPIVPLIVGDSTRALELSRHLLAAGCFVPAIRPPTVPPGTSRLRISLSAAHDREQLQRLLNALGEAVA